MAADTRVFSAVDLMNGSAVVVTPLATRPERVPPDFTSGRIWLLASREIRGSWQVH